MTDQQVEARKLRERLWAGIRRKHTQDPPWAARWVEQKVAEQLGSIPIPVWGTPEFERFLAESRRRTDPIWTRQPLDQIVPVAGAWVPPSVESPRPTPPEGVRTLPEAARSGQSCVSRPPTSVSRPSNAAQTPPRPRPAPAADQAPIRAPEPIRRSSVRPEPSGLVPRGTRFDDLMAGVPSEGSAGCYDPETGWDLGRVEKMLHG